MLNLKKLNHDQKLILKLDSSNIDYYFKYIKKIIKYCDRKKLFLEIYYNNSKINADEINKENDINLKELINVMIAINIKDKYKRYEYIYDTVCNHLDEIIKKENYCDFQNNQCIRDRLKGNNHQNGCCECKGRGKCKYLVNSKCTEKSCIACKLFTCKTIKKKGIEHKVNDFILVKYFFTNKQKDILRFSYWTPKKVILDRLMKNKYVRP